MKGHLLNGILALLLLTSWTSCEIRRDNKNDVATSPAPDVSADSLLVELQRGACFGACPQFIFSVYKSGFAVYQGERHTRRMGDWTARVNAEQLAQIRSLMAEARMEQRDTAYINKYLADYPAYFITVCDRFPRKRIYINHDQPPAEITVFVTELEKIMEAPDWKSKTAVKSDE